MGNFTIINKNMRYCIDETADIPIMLINTHIGMDSEDGMGVDSDVFQRELLYLDTLGKKKIDVWINSIGGVVVDGYSIVSAILKTKTPVDTYNVGLAASIAGVIFMCGRNRIAMDYSLMMVHKPFGGDNSELLDLMQGSLATILSAKCNLSIDDISSLMDKETWLSADECLSQNIATEIETTDSKNKKRMSSITDNYKEFTKISNKLIDNKLITPENNMIKIANKLGLQDEASESAILTAIAEIENKAKSEKEKMKEEMDEMENALNAMKEKYNALSEEVANKVEEDCKNMIDGFVAVGKIADEEEVKNLWVNLAKADMAGTKKLIESTQINKVANKITIEEQAAPAESMMAQAMREIRNRNKK